MFSTPWKQKTALQKGAFISLFLGVCVVCFIIGAFAASFFTSHDSYDIGDGKGHVYEIKIGGQVEGIDILPGTEQTINPSIRNAGSEKLYLFVRFDTNTTAAGNQIFDYSATGGGWSRVDMGDSAAPGQIIYVYGSADEPSVVMPEQTVTLNGKMTAVVNMSEFVDLQDSDFVYTVHGCAIQAQDLSGTASQVYAAYMNAGGE